MVARRDTGSYRNCTLFTPRRGKGERIIKGRGGGDEGGKNNTEKEKMEDGEENRLRKPKMKD